MTITTELAQLEAIAELKAGYKLGHADVAILQDVARELDAARQRIVELEALLLVEVEGTQITGY